MSEVTKHITLPKNRASGDDLDFMHLKELGRQYIERIASKVWTDYNAHDPGITILEALCYAITDLGARISLPIENLLTPPQGAGEMEKQFFKASQILPSKPVNEADYRKLFIDLKGVKNCWLRKYEKTVYVDCKNDRLSYDANDFAVLEPQHKSEFVLNGLYRIMVDFDEQDLNEAAEPEVRKEEIKKAIVDLYHQNRNLCEDLVKVEEVEEHPVQVCAGIELEPLVDEEMVHAKIMRAIDKYFSPDLWFYSLAQMFEKGYSADEIFDGPTLCNGFLDPEELENARLRKEVRLSDIMQLIMDIDGVKVIKDISINDCKNPEENKDVWLLCVPDNKKPVRCEQSAFSYFKGVLPVNINKKQVLANLARLESEEQTKQLEASIGKEINLPAGEYLFTSETTTIQNDFPETYGIGPVGLSSRASTSRKSQAKQLKAYLLFFDQVFASYFAHLEKVKDLLSVNNTLSQTYFTQAVKDISGLEELVRSNYKTNNNSDLTNKLLGELDDNIVRRNGILDHLLARFAENFSEYAFLMKQLYGSYANQSVLDTKQLFLSEYGEIVKPVKNCGNKEILNKIILNKGISNWRGSAFNYFEQDAANLWDTDNVAGAAKRIARLCGMKNFKRRNLSGSFVEVYDLIDSEGETRYRWRIRNTEGLHILSSTVNYRTPQQAETELYFSLMKIVESDPEAVKKAFKEEVFDEDEVENFEVQKSPGGKYSVDVINRAADPGSSDRIIARQYLYFNTQEKLRNSILELIEFFRNEFTEEGMFIVEHILMRPDVTGEAGLMDEFMPVCTDNCESCEPVDPYSYRVTVVMPGWTYRFGNMDFRNFMEDMIRKELPAHVLARICWIGDRRGKVADELNDMMNFERDYKDFLLGKTKMGQAQDTARLKNLITTMTELNTIYPTGKLIDCADEEDSLEGRIILGRTNIGNL